MEKTARQIRKEEKNEIEVLVKNLIKEADPSRPYFVEDQETNKFYQRINSLPDKTSKIRFIKLVLKGVENHFLNKMKKAYPASSLAYGQPIKVWKKDIKEISLYRKLQRVIENLRKNPSFVFSPTYKTYEAAQKDLEAYRTEQNRAKLAKIENAFGFDFDKVKKYGESIKDLKKRILYYEYVNKEFLQNKSFTKHLESTMDTPFEQKLRSEMDYLNKFVDHSTSTGTKITKLKSNKVEVKPIIWFGSGSQLIKLFDLLNKGKFIPKYSNEEIMLHFVNERLQPFTKVPREIEVKPFYWKKADGKFFELVNLLVKNQLVSEYRKYMNFTDHFLNKLGLKFKNPSQIMNFQKNTIVPDIRLIEIIQQIQQFSLSV